MILPSWIRNQVNILKLVGNDITILQSLVYTVKSNKHIQSFSIKSE